MNNNYDNTILQLNEFDKVNGQIYKITNNITNKCYIGQTRTHRLNHTKYRPFGYMSRFKSHISKAFSTNQEQHHCKYMNSTLRKYGADVFKCELITTCKIDELDYYEIKYIAELNTKYPNGYNLTNGGQGVNYLKGKKIVMDESCITEVPVIKEKTSLKRSEYTKKLISENVKKAINNTEHKTRLMKNVQKQHLPQKFDKFKNVIIDQNNIEQYIRIRNNNILNYTFIKIIINKVSTSFVGKYETLEEIKQRAINFIKELIIWQRDQIAGTPLEPLTTTLSMET